MGLTYLGSEASIFVYIFYTYVLFLSHEKARFWWYYQETRFSFIQILATSNVLTCLSVSHWGLLTPLGNNLHKKVKIFILVKL